MLSSTRAIAAWRASITLTFFLMSALVLCAQIPIFEENFENGTGDFLIDNDYGIGHGLWHHSTSCKVSLGGHTQGGALYYGQDNTCDYDIGIANRGVVESPPIDLTSYVSGPIELYFKYTIEVEPAFCGYYTDLNLDLATVEISVDGGYYVTVARNCWAAGLIDLGTPSSWIQSQPIDLSDYAGSVIQLRFGFNTVDYKNNDYDGFYVDDIVIYGPSCNFTIAGDTNHDCVVDMKDFASLVDLIALAENWLLNCYITPSDPGCVPK
jgi:hypothetical protein